MLYILLTSTTAVLLSFDQPLYIITEEDASVEICVILTGATEKTISANLSTFDGNYSASEFDAARGMCALAEAKVSYQ